MRLPAESILVRCLRGLAHAVFHHPNWFLYPQLLLAVCCVWYTVRCLQFSTSRSDLVGSDKKYHTNFLRFKKEFALQEDLVAVVESEVFEKNRQFVERLGARLEKETNLFTGVYYKGDLKMMGPKALLFLPEDTLRELHETIKGYRPFIEDFAQATNLNSLFRKINQQFRTAQKSPPSETQALLQAIPALTRIVQQAADSLDRPGIPPSPGVTALFNAGEQAEREQYITFAGGQMYVVSARPAHEEMAAEAVERLRELVQQTQAEVPGVNVGITGESVLELDEMNQARRDSSKASIFSLLAVALLFVFGYRETGRPIKATLTLLIGLAYTMGYTTLTVGRLNILTVTFLPILIGLAIDFGIHLISRYEEELGRGKGEAEAMEKAIVNTGLGIFTGCLTTSGAFFAMALTDFQGIREMGLITGGGILICLFPMMTVLPVLLLKGKSKPVVKAAEAERARAKMERLWLDRPAVVVGAAGVLCLLSITQFSKVYFDYNLLNMQSKGLAAVIFEKKLIAGASKSVLFGAVVADSLEEAAELQERLAALPAVSGVDSMSQFLVENQSQKLQLIGNVKQALQGLEFEDLDLDSVNVPDLSQTLFYTQAYLGLAIKETKQADELALADQLDSLRRAITSLRKRISSGEGTLDSLKLTAFQKALFADIHETFGTLKTQDDRAPLQVRDLPASLRDRFVGATGKHLLQVYPKENVWQREPQERFVQQLRTIDENATGTPVQLYEYTSLLKESYERAALYALGAIVIMVLIHFRSLIMVMLALLPVATGCIWLLGFMGVTGLPFNPANIMTLPLVIGIGVTNGIHILNRHVEAGTHSILAMSTGKAVLISGLTTIAGFASLIPAQHQGIASLGVVMTLGVFACMISALTILPATLNMASLSKQRKRPSADDAPSTLGREEPR